MMPVLTCRRVIYYSPGDEALFFQWLNSIKAIYKIVGVHDRIGLHIPRRRMSNASLRELLALFRRYKIDMTQLAQFQSLPIDKSGDVTNVYPARRIGRKINRQAENASRSKKRAEP